MQFNTYLVLNTYKAVHVNNEVTDNLTVITPTEMASSSRPLQRSRRQNGKLQERPTGNRAGHSRFEPVQQCHAQRRKRHGHRDAFRTTETHYLSSIAHLTLRSPPQIYIDS